MSWGIHSYLLPCSTSDDWFNGEEGITGLTILVAMVGNIAFGFIDNAGLFFGGCYLVILL